MEHIPTFSEFFKLTTRTGHKEKLAKRFHYLPTNHKILLFNKVKDLKIKPNPETYLNIGR